VKRRLGLVAGGLAAVGAAAYGALRSRRGFAEPDPAEELRRKLDESRALVAEREEFEGAETPVDRAEAGVDERRRTVHEQARAAIDEMRSPEQG
jgi:hypothetical protein